MRVKHWLHAPSARLDHTSLWPSHFPPSIVPQFTQNWLAELCRALQCVEHSYSLQFETPMPIGAVGLK
jgi:hypothetical protein